MLTFDTTDKDTTGTIVVVASNGNRDWCEIVRDVDGFWYILPIGQGYLPTWAVREILEYTEELNRIEALSYGYS